MQFEKKLSFHKVSGMYGASAPSSTQLARSTLSNDSSLRVEPSTSPLFPSKHDTSVLETEIKESLAEIHELQKSELATKLWRSKSKLPLENRTRVDIHTAETIRRLTSILLGLEKEGQAICRERQLVLDETDKIRSEIENKQEHFKNILVLTDGGKTNVAELQNEASRLRAEISRMRDEQIVLQESLNTKSNHIDELLAEILKLKDLERKHLEVMTAIRTNHAEEDELKQDEKTLQLLESRKDRLLENLSVDVTEEIAKLDAEKQSLYQRIQARREKKDTNLRAIMSNNHEIGVLEQHLRHLAVALKRQLKSNTKTTTNKSNNLSNEKQNMVSARTLDSVLEKVQSLRSTLEGKDDLLNAHDIAIEQLERKVDILSRASESAEIRSQYEMKAHSEEYSEMQRIMEQRQSMFEEACEKLKLQQEDLKKKMNKLDLTS